MVNNEKWRSPLRQNNTRPGTPTNREIRAKGNPACAEKVESTAVARKITSSEIHIRTGIGNGVQDSNATRVIGRAAIDWTTRENRR
jgi:hypothetical protein